MVDVKLLSRFEEFEELTDISPGMAKNSGLIPWFADSEDMIFGIQAFQPLDNGKDWIPEIDWACSYLDLSTHLVVDGWHYYLVWEPEH